MALSLRHAFIILLLGWAGVTTAYLPPREPRPKWTPQRDSPERVHATRLSILHRIERNALQALQERDRMQTVVRQQPGRQPVVWTDPSIDQASTLRLERIAHMAFEDSGLTAPKVQSGVAFVRRVGYSGFTEYLLPAQPGDACLAVVALWTVPPPAKDGRLHVRFPPGLVPGVAGPCAFYAAFGTPGLAVQEWLNRGGARFATAGLALSGQVRPADADLYAVYSYFGPAEALNGLACRRGNVDRCAQNVKSASTFAYRPASTRRIPGWIVNDGLELSRFGGMWLGDLAREQGRAKFAQFWHSTLPLDSAFVTAFGVPLGTWTARWVQAHPQNDPRPVHASSVVVTLLCIGLLVTGSAAYATRRQVGL